MTSSPRSSSVGRSYRLGVALALPVFLILTNVRLLLTPLFVSFEYASPGFPADRYGFSRAERLQWADVALEYLLNDAGPEFLAGLASADGTALYKERELGHMVDVKRLVQTALAVWVAATFLLALMLVGAHRDGGWRAVRSGLHLGSRITLILMATLVGLLVISFSTLFVGFHRVFFQEGTWVFYYSDTLIRLFPIRFWQIAFATLLLLTCAEAALILLLTRNSRGKSGMSSSPHP